MRISLSKDIYWGFRKHFHFSLPSNSLTVVTSRNKCIRSVVNALPALQSPPIRLQKLQEVQIAPCNPECTSSATNGWCQFPLNFPAVNWAAINSSEAVQVSVLARGLKSYNLDCLNILVVEAASAADEAISLLKQSLSDSIIGIDLEWRGKQVSLIQLSTSTHCILFRTSEMSHCLPRSLQELLKDPSLHFIGFAWNGADERMMTSTFNFSRKHFGNYFDVQEIAKDLGYGYMTSLVNICKYTLSIEMSKAARKSNWAAKALTLQQIKYAALDALITAYAFRQLRSWHATAHICSSCERPWVYVPFTRPPKAALKILEIGDEVSASDKRTRAKRTVHICEECGRLSQAKDTGNSLILVE